MKKLILLFLVLIPVILPVKSFAELDKSNIVAIVNDVPITKYEFEERKALAVIMFNVDLSMPGAESQLNKNILKSLIETEILKQHAEKVGGKVTNEDVANTIKLLEEQNKMQPGGMRKYLRSQGIKFDTFRKQIVGERIKLNIIQSFTGSVNVSQSEIESALIHNSPKDFAVEAWVFTSRDSSENSHKMMTKLKSRLKGCNKLDQKLYDSFADAEKFDRHLKKLEGRIQSIVEDTREGKSSSVYKDAGRYKLVLVCKKQPFEVSAAEEGNVKYFVLNKKTTLKAEKFLEDLKQKAYVQILDPRLK